MRLATFLVLVVAIISCNNPPSVTGEEPDGDDTLIATEAVALFYDGNYEESLQLLNYSIEKHPEVAELYFWTAKNYVALDSIRSAFDFYSKAIDRNSNEAKYWNNRGLLLFSLGKLQMAEIDFKKALDVDSTLGISYNNLGLVYNKREQYDSAIFFYNQAIKNKHIDKNVHYNKAVTFINLAEFDSAKFSLNKVIDIDPSFAEAYLYRGVCSYKTGDKLHGCSDFWEAKTLGAKEVDEYLIFCED